jgi:hypothetical protein
VDIVATPTQIEATVTIAAGQNQPLTIIADGADTASSAESLNGVAYTAGDRVQVTVRTPRLPLVTGQIATA